MISSFFVIVVVSDSNFLVIPDEVTLVFSILVIVSRMVLNSFSDGLLYLGYGFGAFLIMYLLMLFGNFIFKKESLGCGDIKLMFFIGCSLGPLMSLFTIFLSSFIALPYGPFLLIATLIIVIFKLDSNTVLNFILNMGI